VGNVNAVLEGSFSRRDCRNDRSRGVMVVFLFVLGFEARDFVGGRDVGCTDMCVCAEVPPVASIIQQFDLRKENGKVTSMWKNSRRKCGM
jgi:hypothetical protein